MQTLREQASPVWLTFSLFSGRFWASSQMSELWAQEDLNFRPHPYQGCALTGLSYGPEDVAERRRREI